MPELFGVEHILYLAISTAAASAALLLAKRYARDEKSQIVFLKVLAALLLAAIVTNRLSQVFRYDDVRWYLIIPDSFCGMTSLVLALSVLFGRRDNNVLHFVWLLGLFGGVSSSIYASYVGQGPTIFYLPTISGLLHHSISAALVVAILMFGYIEITYKKWYCTLFGFTSYLTLGAFMMQEFDMNDAFHIAEPLIEGTFLTAWGMAPLYAVGYALILFVIETVKKKRKKADAS
ncbi:MAG: hypothetical protein IKM40_00710 [Clostridia bacterium]|nr:hypothetical protein [Clostridia bacterium]